MKWPTDISLFVNDEGPPIDIWHNGVCGGPMLTTHSMDAAQAIISAIDELHGLRAEIADFRDRNLEYQQTLHIAEQERDAARGEIVNLKRDLSNAEHAVMLWRSAERSASSTARNRGRIVHNKQREIEILTAQVHDLRCALAAERLDPDAGKDLGYELHSGVYTRDVEGGHIEIELYDDKRGRWRVYRFALGLVVPPWREVWADNARAAMREANKKEQS